MSAERLREAARLMRERAQVFGPDRWTPVTVPGRSSQAVAFSDPDGDSPLFRGNREVVEHATSWHPVVALAVADLLDALAGEPVLYEDNPVVRKALAVADAYLGGAE